VCEFVSFGVGILGANFGKIYAGHRLNSHKGIESVNKIKPESYRECEWTSAGLTVRVNFWRNRDKILHSIRSRFPTRNALLKHLFSGLTQAQVRAELERMMCTEKRLYKQFGSALLKRLRNPNHKDSVGKTLLHCAAHAGNIDAVKKLLKKGANVNARDKNGKVPLAMFTDNYTPGLSEIATLLIKRGAKVNVQDNLGWTPLHRAANNAVATVCRTLILAGADTTIKDKNGSTAHDRAHWSEWTRRIMNKALREREAKKCLQKNRKKNIAAV